MRLDKPGRREYSLAWQARSPRAFKKLRTDWQEARGSLLLIHHMTPLPDLPTDRYSPHSLCRQEAAQINFPTEPPDVAAF